MNDTRALEIGLINGGTKNQPVSAKLGAMSTPMWLYCVIVLGLWVADAEIRRLLDWRAGFHATQFLDLVPLSAMVIFLFACRAIELPRPMLALGWIWTGSFVYAGAIGLLSGHGPSALYDFLQFLAPLLAALWLASSRATLMPAFEKLSIAVLYIAVGVSVYGLIQFTALPPWDAAWIRQVATFRHMVTNGHAQPFEVRVFSVLNSASICASFLSVAVALNFYWLKEKKFLRLVGLLACLVILVLTLERAAWVSLAVAFAVYLLFSSRAWRSLSVSLACLAATSTIIWLASPLLVAHAGTNSISTRIQSFSRLSQDASVHARLGSTTDLLSDALAYPTGEGLGIIGRASQLTSFRGSANTTDGGLQARFAEMGFAGFVGYLATLFLAFGLTIARWLSARRAGNHSEIDALASLLAVQAVLIVLDLSVDSHSGLLGLLFWLSVGLAALPAKPAQELVTASPATPHRTLVLVP